MKSEKMKRAAAIFCTGLLAVTNVCGHYCGNPGTVYASENVYVVNEEKAADGAAVTSGDGKAIRIEEENPDRFENEAGLELESIERAADSSASGKAVKLPSSVMNYRGYGRESRQIPYEKLGGIYFLNDKELIFYDLNSKKSSVVYSFFSMLDSYKAGNILYVLAYQEGSWMEEKEVIAYNLDKKAVERTITISCDADALGVDAKGRIYLASYEEKGEKRIYLLSAEGEILSTVTTKDQIYEFCGFDSKNGNFYVIGYDNYVYWGYNHDMNAVRMGNVNGDKLSFSDSVITYACQSYFFERQNQVEVLSNKYLCIDSTYKSKLFLIDSNNLSIKSKKVKTVAALSRNNMEAGSFDKNASVGTRTVYRPKKKSFITFQDNHTLTEYSIKTGKVIHNAATSYPVFSLMEYGNDIIAIEKQGDSFYYERFPWTEATSVKITGKSGAMKSGSTRQLKFSTNGTLKENVTWSSSKPKVASVNQSGKVYAWAKGKTQIKVKTQSGLTAKFTITVSKKSKINTAKKNKIVTKGAKTVNISYNNYNVYGSTVNSYLVQNSDGTLTRVEYNGSKVIVENYNSTGSKLKSRKKIKMELNMFGGFYSGKKYNYLVFGKKNTKEKDSAEIMRIVKYSKKWKKMKTCKVKGANTYIPFDAGSLRMTETAGSLYIHTCHEMYKSSDGLHHQANMTFVVDENKMKVKQSYSGVMNIAQAGYVSHSFNQFIQADDSYVYRVDHGDAYPRGISITKCGIEDKITSVDYTIPIPLGKVSGYNPTGASVGGFALASQSCVIAGNAVNYKKSNISYSSKRNIFVSITDKELNSTKVVWLTKYKSGSSYDVRTPQLVKLDSDQFLVMWEEVEVNSGKIRTQMAAIDSNGKITAGIVSSNMRLSDCQPIKCKDGLVRWYVTDYSSPVIYTVNPVNLKKSSKI